MTDTGSDIVTVGCMLGGAVVVFTGYDGGCRLSIGDWQRYVEPADVRSLGEAIMRRAGEAGQTGELLGRGVGPSGLILEWEEWPVPERVPGHRYSEWKYYIIGRDVDRAVAADVLPVPFVVDGYSRPHRRLAA